MSQAKKKPATPNAGVSISVDDQNMGRVAEVADDLRAAGLHVDRVMHSIGTITGSVEAAKMPALKKVRGVAGVEREQTVQLPPPDAEVQ